MIIIHQNKFLASSLFKFSFFRECVENKWCRKTNPRCLFKTDNADKEECGNYYLLLLNNSNSFIRFARNAAMLLSYKSNR